MRFVAQIPEKLQEQNIKWLILEEDEEDTGGVYLYCHKSLSEESEYDGWYEDMRKAQKQAQMQWGVGTNDWRVYP